MSTHELEDEMQEMFEHERRGPKILSTDTIRQPIRSLELARAVVVESSATVGDTIELMQHKKIGCVLVAKNSQLVGIFTERDVLMKLLNKKVDYAKIAVNDVMTRSPESLRMDDSIASAMNLMSVGGFRHLPIVDENRKPMSILSVKDIVSYFVGHFPDEVLNLPPKPLRTTSEREGA